MRAEESVIRRGKGGEGEGVKGGIRTRVEGEGREGMGEKRGKGGKGWNG